MQIAANKTPEYLSFDYMPSDGISRHFMNSFFYELELDKGNKIKLRNDYIDTRLDAFYRTLSTIIVRTELNPNNAVYHSLMTSSFSDEPVSQSHFKTITGKLLNERYILREKGHRFYIRNTQNNEFENPKACHFYPTSKLIEKCLNNQIFPDHLDYLFEKIKPTDFVKVRYPSTRDGKHRYKGDFVNQNKIQDTNGYKKQQIMMEKINDYLWSQSFTNTEFNGLYRNFNNFNDRDYKYDQGGRLCVPGLGYQSLSKENRRHILINNQETVEIDIKASHLSILHGILNMPLEKGDPYDLGDIPRDIVKQWMTISLSQATPLKQWPVKTRNELIQKFYDMDQWTAPKVSKLALEKYPFLNNMNEDVHGWANLQYIESELIIKTMIELMDNHDVPSLPVHDSLIVPKQFCDLTKGVLKKHFKASLGIEMQLTVSGNENTEIVNSTTKVNDNDLSSTDHYKGPGRSLLNHLSTTPISNIAFTNLHHTY